MNGRIPLLVLGTVSALGAWITSPNETKDDTLYASVNRRPSENVLYLASGTRDGYRVLRFSDNDKDSHVDALGIYSIKCDANCKPEKLFKDSFLSQGRSSIVNRDTFSAETMVYESGEDFVKSLDFLSTTNKIDSKYWECADRVLENIIHH